MQPWVPTVMAALATAAGAVPAGLPSDNCSTLDPPCPPTVAPPYIPTSTLTFTTVTVSNTQPWPTDLTPSPMPLPTVEVPSTCRPGLSVCVDKLKTCGTTAVLTYGGCFPACSPMPTFVEPPCPTSDAGLTTVNVPTTWWSLPSDITWSPVPMPTVVLPTVA